MTKSEKSVTFEQNPEIDILFGIMGMTIPSKKQDFKPVTLIESHEDGCEEILNNFYVKKPSSKSVREFEALIQKVILDAGYNERIIKKPGIVEVLISINLKEKKYFDIDVDNIAKIVLDSLIGYLIEDDSQVKRVICQKDIHTLNYEGFFIAVTELTDERRGLLGDLHLFSEKTE